MAGVMAFSRDTKLVASGSPDGLIEIWNSGNNDTHEVARLSDRVADLAFSSDGKMLAACDDYKVCGIWSVSSGHPMRTSAHDRGHLALAFSQDGLTVLLATFNRDSRKEGGIVDLEFVFWDVMTGAQSVFEGLEIYVPSGKVAISPDMTAATYPREDYVALVKVPGTGQSSSKRLLSGHESAIGGATFSPDSKTVVTACLRSIRTWDVATGECKLVVPTDFRGPDVPPPAPIMSPDGYTIAARFRRATVSENYIGLWSTENGTKRKEFAMKFTTHDFASAFAPDGESFALLSDGEDRHVVLTTWDTLGAPNSEQSHKLKTKPPEDLVVSEAKQWVALAFRDRSFELWSVASDNAIAARILLWQESIDSGFTPARNLCFSSNGKRLAYQQHMTPVGSDKTDCVRVRDTETGEILPPTAWDDSDMAGVRIGFWDDGYRRVIPEPQMAALPVDIPVAGSWLCVNSDPVLLLPSQCRLHEAYRKTGLLAVDGNTIALAFASGKFSVLRVHPSKMQRFLGQHSYIPHLVQQRNYIGSVTLHWDTTGTQGVYTSVV
jgi:WD40 repeat protein